MSTVRARHGHSSMQRVYVQCDNEVASSVSLHDATGPCPLHPERNGLRPARMHLSDVSLPGGADRRPPGLGPNRTASDLERYEGVMTLFRHDVSRPDSTAHTVRNHGGRVLRGAETCRAVVGCHTSGDMKTPGAPTPDVLEIRFVWCAPEIDQTVAKR